METNSVNQLVMSDFELGVTLGTGSFGRVRICKNKNNGDCIALKIMKKLDIIKSKQIDHIMNEIKILAMIKHPFVISFFGFSQDEMNLYLGLELINGGELFTYLRGVGHFGSEQSQ
jgi:serine/threonine protein kinase